MTSYFKYSNGEAFILNGSDYSGFFNVIGGEAYTGKVKTLDSDQLTPKNTFISKFFLSELELDTTYQNISTPTPYYSNVFDIFNKQELDTILDQIDRNNLLIFKSLILKNPTVYRVEENDTHFYGLSSTDVDPRNDDQPNGKNVYTHIDPFSNDSEWGFMDSIRMGTFLVDTHENFKYICSTGTTNYVLSGNFSNLSPLTVISKVDLPHPQALHHIYNDDFHKRISFVYNDFIYVYDSSNYADCDKLLLVDVIDLVKTSTIDYIFGITDQTFGSVPVTFNTRFVTTNFNNPKFIKFGLNLRTSLINNTLRLVNKYSSDVFQTIYLSDLKIFDVLSLDIRQEDDNIIIMHRSDGVIKVTYFDPTDMKSVKTTVLSDIVLGQSDHSIHFSKLDSNLFYTENKKEFHTRFITYPKYANGRLENADLLYLDDYVFGTTIEKFNRISIKWNSTSMESNSYNNILTNEYVANDKMYTLLHNIGRVYALKQSYTDAHLRSIPLDLIKYYDGIICSESSFGLYFNNSISNLVKDTLSLYNQASNSFKISEDGVSPNPLPDISFHTENLYLNGNETINIVSMQRILLLITELQKKLLSVSI